MALTKSILITLMRVPIISITTLLASLSIGVKLLKPLQTTYTPLIMVKWKTILKLPNLQII